MRTSDYDCRLRRAESYPLFDGYEPGVRGRRARVIDEIIPAVVPSSLGDPRFNIIARGIHPQHPVVVALAKQGKKYTTCGHLTGHVGAMLGDPVLGRGATNGLRTAALAKNAWVIPLGTNRPRPGDLFALNYRGVKDHNAGISHVGVIIEVDDTRWVTADAGQSGGFAAAYLTRRFDPDNLTLSDDINVPHPRPPRLLAGWLDLDAYFADPWDKKESRPTTSGYTPTSRHPWQIAP